MKTGLFSSHELDVAWDWAVGPNVEHRLESLQKLIAARDELPGPVFFTVPTAGFHLQRERWKTILAETRSYCKCPARRVLWPEVGRTRMIPSERPSRTLACERTFVVDFFNARPLVIAPHGGDLASAYAFWTFQGDQLLVKQQPFLKVRDLNQRLVRNSTGRNYSTIRPDRWEAHPHDIEQWVRRFGEISFQQVVPLGRGTVGESWLPTCSIRKLAWTADTQRRPVLTIELDAAVRVLPYSEDEPLHECNPAIPEQ